MPSVNDKTPCKLCDARPPRRFCPALNHEICAVCCGTEREQTISCPFDCDYLREARRHEKRPELDPKAMPHREIELSDRFLRQQEQLVLFLGRLLLMSAMSAPGAVDLDMRDALDALVRTLKTAESGLVYESRPANLIAAAIQEKFQIELAKLREMVAERSGVHSIRDKEVLGALVFWQRTEWQTNNGRRKGRAFIESLFALMPTPEELDAQRSEESGIVLGS